MGEGRRRKSSEKLRRGRLPVEGLAFSAIDDHGMLAGTVRLWNVHTGLDAFGFRFQLCCSARLQSIHQLPVAVSVRP